MSEHIVSAKTNIAVWLALLVLTGVTAGVAFIDLGPFNTVVALVIATFKALAGRPDLHARQVCQR